MSLIRNVQKWAEPRPILGLLAIAPPAIQGKAFWHALITALIGSIGLWLPQATRAIETQLHLGIGAVISNLLDATLRGDMLVLVPALLAPLYLLSPLVSDKRMQAHQWWILGGAVVLGGIALWVYTIKIANQVADNNFLLLVSLIGLVFTFSLLYLYFLQNHLNGEDVVHSLQDASNPMVDELERRHKEQEND